MMTPTERVMTALRHREPDRVPVYESFWPEFVDKWRREKRLGQDVDIHEYYRLDLPGDAKVACDQTPWPSGQRELDRRPGYRLIRNGWGSVVKRLDTMSLDEMVEPGIKQRSDLAAMPPFGPASLDARFAAVPDWVRTVAAKGFCLFAKTGGPFSRTWPYRGMERFLMDMIEDPGFAAELLARQTDLLVATLGQMLRRADVPPTCVWIADDCAYRNAPLFAPRLYERLIQPHLARLCRFIHSTGRLAAFESEGHTLPLLGLILDAGVDVLTNLEPRAGMDVVELKRRFTGSAGGSPGGASGRPVAFIGTMCNTVVLPRGTVQEVRAETLRTLRVGVGGGVVFGSAHTIGSDVPVANYEAFIDTLREFGTYPLRL